MTEPRTSLVLCCFQVVAQSRRARPEVMPEHSIRRQNHPLGCALVRSAAGLYVAAMSANKVTVPELRRRKQNGPKIAMLTAYDATFARLFDDGGADVLLVGDSLGMVVQGYNNTLPVTLEEMAYHARAVARAAKRAHVVVDMPFMSYQGSTDQALANAGMLVKTGGAEAVKLEGGTQIAATVERIVAAGIPVMGHLGLTPQSVHQMGGFRVQGKRADEAKVLVQHAQALEAAGVYSIVLEGIPTDVGQRLTQSVSVPTIGIGAGPHCDGQVLVCYDALGLLTDFKPKFVKRFAELGPQAIAATGAYVKAVQNGSFPDAAHSFKALGQVSDTRREEAPSSGVPVKEQATGYGPGTQED